MKIGLSIDFDFFCREKQDWDWIHPLHKESYTTWLLRYLNIDLQKECDPHKYADFNPVNMKSILSENGFDFSESQYGVADNHVYAHSFFCHDKQIKTIINFDAHHDCWPIYKNKIDCSSWLTSLKNVKAVSVYPKWKDPYADSEPDRDVKIIKWKDFKNEKHKYKVLKTFICRSSPWVPPHLDSLFLKFVDSFTKYPLISYEKIVLRNQTALQQISKIRNKELTNAR